MTAAALSGLVVPLAFLAIGAGVHGCAAENTPPDSGSGGTAQAGTSGAAPNAGAAGTSAGSAGGAGTSAGGSGMSAGGAGSGAGGAIAGGGGAGSGAGGATAGGGGSGMSAGGAGSGAGGVGGSTGGSSAAGGAGGMSGAQTSGGAAGAGASGGSTSGTGGSIGGAGGGTADGCPTELVGYATVNAEGVNGTTGGGNATPTVVTTLSALRSAAQDSAPRVVVVSGTINTTSDGDGYPMSVASNKTIVGADKDATIVGGLRVNNANNVIISNLNIEGVWPDSGPGDTLSTSGSHHVWFDHLNVWDAEDGLLDITNASDYQTVSWSKFWYTDAAHDHRLASLNGSGGGDHPEDWGHLRVTYHHNWFAALVDQRMPRVMYGEGHQFNNYYNSPGNSYCIGVGSYGSVLIENNYFKDVNDPHLFMYDVYMYAAASGNVYDNTTGARDTGMGGARDVAGQESFDPGPFEPPYDYTLEPAEDVPELVQRCAGPR